MTLSEQFSHDFEEELKDPNFIRKISQDLESEFIRLRKKADPTFIADWRKSYELAFIQSLGHENGVKTFFNRFYQYAIEHKEPKATKWDHLENAKGGFLKMMIFESESSNNPPILYHDLAFAQAINQQYKQGYTLGEVRDMVWKRVRPRFKPGKKPSSSLKLNQIRETYRMLLEMLSPAFGMRSNVSSKIIHNKNAIIESAVEWVFNNNPVESFDIYELAGKYFYYRKAERVAIDLTKRMFGKSISTIERAISLRNAAANPAKKS